MQSLPTSSERWAFFILSLPTLLILFVVAMMSCGTVGAAEAVADAVEAPAGKIEFELERGKYHVVIDMRGSPDLEGWCKEKLVPVVKEWYPTIVHMLPSKDFHAPTEVTITIGDSIKGVAYTMGNQIHCNGNWMRDNLDKEAKGAVVHELVHVVQQYRGWRVRNGKPGTHPPGWLVEGIPDYIRWFLYEPESGGALIGARGAARARHDASYRTSANFLSWVADRNGASLIPKLNARLRAGEYNADFWKEYTGDALEDLATAWKKSLANPKKAVEDTANANQLTTEEKEQGWKLLFDGKSTDGWHSFKQDEALPGWKVADGKLICQDPRQAGDLCTDESYEWFELRLEYNISQGGNSGIMFHVTNEGGAAWATGPEFQLEDNMEAHDSVRCGWLYALYQPADDADTGMPIDATKPAGQWNTIRLLVSPEKCVHEVNGVKYFEYKLGSEEFLGRIAASKFSRMSLFAKPPAGMLALQGDHGVVSFRNIKVRPITSK